MTSHFFKAHFFFEFVGTALFVFVSTMISHLGVTFSLDSYAFMPSLVWGAIRFIRPSTTLSPFSTLIPELIILQYHSSAKGWLKIIGSIACQLGGAVFGAWLAFFFQGSDSDAFAVNLTAPAPNSATTVYQMMLGDFVWCLAIGCAEYAYMWRLIKAYKESRSNDLGFEIEAEDEGAVQLVPQYDAAGIAGILMVALYTMYDTTRGSFIVTRSFGPAVILNNFGNLGFYVLGQFAGYLLACLLVFVYLFDHF
jgi:hypothetical protein